MATYPKISHLRLKNSIFADKPPEIGLILNSFPVENLLKNSSLRLLKDIFLNVIIHAHTSQDLKPDVI